MREEDALMSTPSEAVGVDLHDTTRACHAWRQGFTRRLPALEDLFVFLRMISPAWNLSYASFIRHRSSVCYDGTFR